WGVIASPQSIASAVSDGVEGTIVSPRDDSLFVSLFVGGATAKKLGLSRGNAVTLGSTIVAVHALTTTFHVPVRSRARVALVMRGLARVHMRFSDGVSDSAERSLTLRR